MDPQYDMFEPGVYAARRSRLQSLLPRGVAVFAGNGEAPRNYAHNVYPFSQDGSFLYFFGISRPGLVGVVDLDEAHATLFGHEPTVDDRIWGTGAEAPQDLASLAACDRARPHSDLHAVLAAARQAGRPIHYLPPYRAETAVLLAELAGVPLPEVASHASKALVRAVVALRECKEAREIDQIEQALAVTHDMHLAAMRSTRPGRYEREVVAEMRALLEALGLREAYAPIFSRNGHILHNTRHDQRLEPGDLVINDSGATSRLGYASDITRTLPVGGRFAERQRALYQIVHQAQADAIAALRPGVAFAQVHRVAALTVARGMRDLGLFRGTPEDIVDSGAYALCFPHGLGHALGLDVHDMESLGEDEVGYGAQAQRSALFGLSNLRLAKALREDMVVTIEPGIYFIPFLIRQWHQQERHKGLIDYRAFEAMRDAGGIRIEDDVLVTAGGARVLGPPIPRAPEEVERAMQH